MANTRSAKTGAAEPQSESVIQNEIRAALARLPNSLILRNALGSDLLTGIPYGLGKGTSDLVGCVNGWFVAIEIKHPDRKTKNAKRIAMQDAWHQVVRRAGGLAGFATSVEEAMAIIAPALR
jgi:hypothetical protein